MASSRNGSLELNAVVVERAPLVLAGAGVDLPPAFSSLATIKAGLHKESKGSSEVFLNTTVSLGVLVCGAHGSGKTRTVARLISSYLQSQSLSGCAGLLLYMGTGDRRTSDMEHMDQILNAIGSSTQSETSIRMSVFAPQITLVHETISSSFTRLPLRLSKELVTRELVIDLLAMVESHPAYFMVMEHMEDADGWNYQRFRKRVNDLQLGHGAWVRRRLALLDTLLLESGDQPRFDNMFSRGHLTVIDLSELSSDILQAAAIFKCILSGFLSYDRDTPKVIALDACEKLFSKELKSASFTSYLRDLSSEPGATNSRIIISTQNPTDLPTDLVAASSLVIMHNFWAPSWFQFLASHTAPVDSPFCAEVVKLQPGHAALLAPRAIRVQKGVSSDAGTLSVVGWEHLWVQVPPPPAPKPRKLGAKIGYQPTPSHLFTPTSQPPLSLDDDPPASSSSDRTAVTQPPPTPGDDTLFGDTSIPEPPTPDEAPLISFSEDDFKALSDMTSPRPPTPTEGQTDDWFATAVHQFHTGPSSNPAAKAPSASEHSDTASTTADVGVPDLSGEDFRPLLDALRDGKAAHIEILFYNLRNMDGVPGQLPAFKDWVETACVLGLIFADGDNVSLTAPTPLPQSESRDETVLLTPSTFHGQANASSSKSPAGEVPAMFVPLVQLLRSQRAEGRARSTCSYLVTVLRRKSYPWMTKTWSSQEYFVQAAQLGLLTVVWNESDGWVTISEYGRIVTLPAVAAAPAAPAAPTPKAAKPATKKKASPKRFEPLRGLFAHYQRETINGGLVGELRKISPGLIPLGAGEVKLYTEDAIAAGVIKFADARKEWITLIG